MELVMYHPGCGVAHDATGHATVSVGSPTEQYEGNHEDDGYSLASHVEVDGRSLWLVSSSRYEQPTLYRTREQALEGIRSPRRVSPPRPILSVPH